MRLVLASGSPRRSDLLRRAGLEFEVVTPEVDESMAEGEEPSDYVERLARAKAAHGAGPGRVGVGADTAVVCDGRVYGKPGSPLAAAATLRVLRGRRHQVLTGVAVVTTDVADSAVARASVVMRPMSDEDIERYVATGEPLDKAGGYALQGLGAAWVEEVEGDPETVIGLPTAVVDDLLARLGLTDIAGTSD